MVVHAKLHNDPLLVSAPATTHPLSGNAPYLSPCSRSSNVTTDEDPLPSHEQATAISDLKAFDELSVLTWLTLLRSIDPSIHLRAGHSAPGCLTNQQLRALVTLRSCPNDHVAAWLDLALLSGMKLLSSKKPIQLMASNRQRFPPASLLRKQALNCKASDLFLATAYPAKFSKVLEQVVSLFDRTVLDKQQLYYQKYPSKLVRQWQFTV